LTGIDNLRADLTGDGIDKLTLIGRFNSNDGSLHLVATTIFLPMNFTKKNRVNARC